MHRKRTRASRRLGVKRQLSGREWDPRMLRAGAGTVEARHHPHRDRRTRVALPGAPVTAFTAQRMAASVRRPPRLLRQMVAAGPSLIEFPADDAKRARRFWTGVLGVEVEPRPAAEGEGWQTHTGATEVGVHS